MGTDSNNLTERVSVPVAVIVDAAAEMLAMADVLATLHEDDPLGDRLSDVAQKLLVGATDRNPESDHGHLPLVVEAWAAGYDRTVAILDDHARDLSESARRFHEMAVEIRAYGHVEGKAGADRNREAA